MLRYRSGLPRPYQSKQHSYAMRVVRFALLLKGYWW